MTQLMERSHVEVEAKAPSRLGRIRNRIAGVFATAAAAIVVPISAASAAVEDPTIEETVSGAFGEVQSMFLGVIVPAVVGLTVAVLAIVLAIKWIRRTAKTS